MKWKLFWNDLVLYTIEEPGICLYLIAMGILFLVVVL